MRSKPRLFKAIRGFIARRSAEFIPPPLPAPHFARAFLDAALTPLHASIAVVELLLNLAWVVLCVIAGACWWTTSGRHLDTRERRARALALGLILLLLFPVISLTDDFQSTIALSETEHSLHTTNLPAPWDTAAALPVLLAALCAVALAAMRPAPRAVLVPARLRRGYLRVLASRPPPLLFPRASLRPAC